MPDEHSNDDPLAAFGPNEWLVDELYEQYRQDKNLVDEAWWSFFEDYTPDGGGGTANGATAAPAPDSEKTEPVKKRGHAHGDGGIE